MKVRNQIEYSLWGRYALFSDPVTRMGGEKSSYMVPTYQALKGVTESVCVAELMRRYQKLTSES